MYTVDKQSSLSLTVVVILLNLGFCSQAAEQTSLVGVEESKIINNISPSFIKVRYTIKADKGQYPELGGWTQRCPSCGQYHLISGSEELLEEERPLETAGYLVAPNKVLTQDLMVHPRFVESIELKFDQQSVTAKMLAYSRKHPVVLLEFQGTLEGARPLEFKPLENKEKLSIVSYGFSNGCWKRTVSNAVSSVVVAEDATAFRVFETTGVVVNKDAAVGGIIAGGKLPLDYSWLGSVMQWDWISDAQLQQMTEKIKAIADNCLLRVRLNLRSPKQSGQRSYYDEDEEDSKTEMDKVVVLIDNRNVIVLANLGPRVTARLEKITVYSNSGKALKAKFAGTLSDYGAFMAELETPLDDTIMFAEGNILEYENTFLLYADIEMQGEKRVCYYGYRRIPSFEKGWHSQIYPEIPGSTKGLFLFNEAAHLIAVPVARRKKIPSDEDRWYYDDQPPLVWSGYISSVLANLAKNINTSNIPLSKTEENKLAWIGVELQALDKELARINKVSDLTNDGQSGALVSYVYADSPASKANIEPGAILLRLYIEGMAKPVEIDLRDSMYMMDFPWEQYDSIPSQYFDQVPKPWPSIDNKINKMLTEVGFGNNYSAEFALDGKIVNKQFVVEEGPRHYDSASQYKSEEIGITVRNITYEVRRYFQRMPDDPGVIVSKIESGQKAAVAGIKPYEIITHINDMPVKNVDDFEKMTSKTGELKLSIKRKMKGRIVKVTVEKPVQKKELTE